MVLGIFVIGVVCSSPLQSLDSGVCVWFMSVCVCVGRELSVCVCVRKDGNKCLCLCQVGS